MDREREGREKIVKSGIENLIKTVGAQRFRLDYSTVSRIASGSLLVIGAAAFLAAGGLLVSNCWGERESQAMLRSVSFKIPTPISLPLETATPEIFITPEGNRPLIVATPTISEVIPVATPSPEVTIKPEGNPAPVIEVPVVKEKKAEAVTLQALNIPSIELESPVVLAPRKEGTWEVPKFKVGQMKIKNSDVIALVGHVESISSGKVFERLAQVQEGDIMYLQTDKESGDKTLTYQVTQVTIVARDDVNILRPEKSNTAVLITCTGKWIPEIKDYDQRLIVIAEPK